MQKTKDVLQIVFFIVWTLVGLYLLMSLPKYFENVDTNQNLSNQLDPRQQQKQDQYQKLPQNPAAQQPIQNPPEQQDQGTGLQQQQLQGGQGQYTFPGVGQ